MSSDHDMDPLRALAVFKRLLEKYYKKEELAKYPDIFLVKPADH